MYINFKDYATKLFTKTITELTDYSINNLIILEIQIDISRKRLLKFKTMLSIRSFFFLKIKS